MYALILVGYVVLGGGQYAGSTVASQLVLGHFDSARSCNDAIGGFDRSKAFKDGELREYRWGLLCLPSGPEGKN